LIALGCESLVIVAIFFPFFFRSLSLSGNNNKKKE
jgi:hypothetical protein